MTNESKENTAASENLQPETTETEADEKEEGLYTWQGQERTWLLSGASWYFYGALIALGLLLYALVTQAWTLAVLISLLAGTIYLYSQEQSPVVDIVLTNKGIYVGDNYYPYTLIKSARFSFEPKGSYLVIELLNTPQSRISISFKADERPLLQTFLKEHVVIDDFHQDTWLEKLEKML